MAETVTLQQVYDELRDLKREVAYIKEQMIDPDLIMTADESEEFEVALKEIKEGQTVPLAKVEADLGI